MSLMTDYEDGKREAFRQVRETRLLQDERAVARLVREAAAAGQFAEAEAILNAYGALLERRPQMLEDLPAIERTEWEVRVKNLT